MGKKKETIKVGTPEAEFEKKVAELKEALAPADLLKIVSRQPENHELRDFLAARKALDELGVKYSLSFK